MIFINFFFIKCGVFLAKRPSAGHSWQWHIHPNVRHWKIARTPVQTTLKPVLVHFIGENYHVIFLKSPEP